MNSTLALMMGTEYVVKGTCLFPIWCLSKLGGLLPGNEAEGHWKKVSDYYRKWYQAYADRLNVTPFYAQSYLGDIRKYWNEFSEQWRSEKQSQGWFGMVFNRTTVRNLTTGIVLTGDLAAKALVSTPINAFYGGEDQGDDREIGLIVKTDKTLPDYVAEEGLYTAIVTERYRGLEKRLRELIEQEVEIVEIAGQTEIQLDLLMDKKESVDDPLYERACLEDASKKIVAVRIDVKDLPKYFKEHEIYRVCDY